MADVSRQHAYKIMHAERDIVVANLSVCPSIQSHTGIVSKRMHI